MWRISWTDQRIRARSGGPGSFFFKGIIVLARCRIAACCTRPGSARLVAGPLGPDLSDDLFHGRQIEAAGNEIVPDDEARGPWELEGTSLNRRLGKGCLDLSRSEEQTYELQSLMRISYTVFCLKKKIKIVLLVDIDYS